MSSIRHAHKLHCWQLVSAVCDRPHRVHPCMRALQTRVAYLSWRRRPLLHISGADHHVCWDRGGNREPFRDCRCELIRRGMLARRNTTTRVTRATGSFSEGPWDLGIRKRIGGRCAQYRDIEPIGMGDQISRCKLRTGRMPYQAEALVQIGNGRRSRAVDQLIHEHVRSDHRTAHPAEAREAVIAKCRSNQEHAILISEGHPPPHDGANIFFQFSVRNRPIRPGVA